MALTSASTYADALAQYRDSAGYNRSSLSASASLALAEDFAEAIRHMLAMAQSSSFQDTQHSYPVQQWQKELDRVTDFIESSAASDSAGAGGAVRKISFANARS